MNHIGLLRSELRRLTKKDWFVSQEIKLWDIRYKCVLGAFNYYTEWRDDTTYDVIRRDAELIALTYEKRNEVFRSS